MPKPIQKIDMVNDNKHWVFYGRERGCRAKPMDTENIKEKGGEWNIICAPPTPINQTILAVFLPTLDAKKAH